MSAEEKQEKSGGIPSQPWGVPSSGRCEIYSNLFHLHWTRVDVRIRFGIIFPDHDMPPETASPKINEVGAVTIDWAQAKQLRDALNSAIARYEEKNGEINWPELP